MFSRFTENLDDEDRQALDFLLAKAAEEGANRALRRLGFDDEHAAGDVRDMRMFVGAFRDLRKQTMQLFIRWLAYLIVGFIVVALGSKLGVSFPGFRSN